VSARNRELLALVPASVLLAAGFAAGVYAGGEAADRLGPLPVLAGAGLVALAFPALARYDADRAQAEADALAAAA
jgi:hypothetical protein